MVGMFLKEREVQYIAHKDDVTRTWRILDTWHEDLADLGPEDEVDDTSPAVTILTEGGFISLVKEASRLGVLENASIGGDTTELEEEIEGLHQQIEDLKEQLKAAPEAVVVPATPPLPQKPKSEGYLLKEMAMQTLLKLTSMSDIENMTKD